MTMTTIDTLGVLAMAVLFAVFLGAMWWETRRVLQELSDNERVSMRWESEQAFRREMAREQARYRLSEMRVAHNAALPLTDNSEANALEPEHIGRILERLAQIETSMEPEWESVPELNFVRGGQNQKNEAAVMIPTRKSGKATRRGAQNAPLPFGDSDGPTQGSRGSKTPSTLLATATR